MAELVSYVVVLGISVLFVLGILYGLSVIKDDYSSSFARFHSSRICYDILSVVKLIDNGNYTSGHVNFHIPDKIGDQPYRIVFSEQMISIQDLHGDIMYTCGGDYNMSGRISGGKNRINFDRSMGSISIFVEGV
ncbi:MAG: hypothetical protein ABIA21_01485 [Candidatus Aenigmatarchaeota archaeon]